MQLLPISSPARAAGCIAGCFFAGAASIAATLAVEEVARADQSLAVRAMVSMATGLTLARFGSEAQQERWLPDIAAGRRICAIAGTEPQAGSDTAGFRTFARRTDSGFLITGVRHPPPARLDPPFGLRLTCRPIGPDPCDRAQPMRVGGNRGRE